MRTENLVYSAPSFSAYEAQKLTAAASAFQSDIHIIHSQRRANAKSIIGLFSVQLKTGDEFLITAEGVDEEEAMAALIGFFGG